MQQPLLCHLWGSHYSLGEQTLSEGRRPREKLEADKIPPVRMVPGQQQQLKQVSQLSFTKPAPRNPQGAAPKSCGELGQHSKGKAGWAVLTQELLHHPSTLAGSPSEDQAASSSSQADVPLSLLHSELQHPPSQQGQVSDPRL